MDIYDIARIAFFVSLPVLMFVALTMGNMFGLLLFIVTIIATIALVADWVKNTRPKSR